MDNSSAITGWLQVLIAFVALILFIYAEREKLFVKKIKDSEPPKELAADVEFRAGLYSRLLIGIILGLSIGNSYLWISNYFQQSFSRNTLVISLVAILLTTIISLFYIRTTPDLKSFFVHWAERLIIVFSYLYILSTYVYCSEYSLSVTCSYYLQDRGLLIGVLTTVLLSYPTTPIDWLVSYFKR